MASNLTGINKPPVVVNDPAVNAASSKSRIAELAQPALRKPPATNRTPDVVVQISKPAFHSNEGITPLKRPKPISPKDDPSIKVPELPKNAQPISYPKPINPKDDPYIGQITNKPSKPAVPQHGMRDDKTSGLFNPYKDLNTVQGWNTAFKTHGVGINKSSPYYAAAHQGQTIHDANGNFMLNQNLGTEVTKGYTKYKLASQDNVDGKIVYTYIKSGNV
jgi:hypothetical protein